MNISKIQVVDRHRRDLGDIEDLRASIALHGLMHPIVITEEGRLIAGQRRYEACKSLGWIDIPVTFITNVSDAASLLEMERDENTCRKEMTPSECVALGRALEELERPNAEQRRALGQKHGNLAARGLGVPPNTKPERAKTREVVAPAVGMSPTTYARAKQLVTAAETGDVVAAEQVQEMDRTGKVTVPFDTWKAKTASQPAGRNDQAPVITRDMRAEMIRDLAEQGYSSRQMPAKVGVTEESVRKIARDFDIEIPADRSVRGSRRVDSNHIVANTVTALEGLVMGVELVVIDDLDPQEASQWADSLNHSLRALNRFVKQIKETTHD